MAMNTEHFTNTVNGEARHASSLYHGIDPTSKQRLWDVPVATRQDLDDAVSAAGQAFKTWSKTHFEERRRICSQFGQLYKENMEFFDVLVSKECGKPVRLTSGLRGLSIRSYLSTERSQ
jgi:acyl-CoA reductase-like NAD-dependent aldehyde dehydrogenase